MDVEPVADLAATEALAAQGDGLLAETLEIGVPACGFRHTVSVVWNANVRVQSALDSPFRAIVDRFVPRSNAPRAVQVARK
ncbi:hypothetical protein ACFVYE_10690 [Streptomyces sp. NPDC058239]|uniref:hypothetical protein n=1 Tax=Streptomyces sp. NPDC058239 TaxID=3346395 RepID=UPI0036E00DAA